MQVNTLVGAIIATLITVATGSLALLQGEDVTAITDVSQLQWIILVIGGLIAFLKDYQAIRIRRMTNKITHSGDGGGTV